MLQSIFRLAVVVLLLAAVSCSGTANTGPNPPGGDNIDPSIDQITGVVEGNTVSGTVAITATASDNIGVTSFTLAIAGTQVATSATGALNHSWDTTTAADGAVALLFTARDAAGNVDTQTVNVTVNNDGGGGGNATVSGIVLAPNGEDPVAGALVFVQGSAASAIGDPPTEPYAAFTYSDADGSFQLTGVPTGSQTLKFLKGAFEKLLTLTVAEGANTLTPAQTTLDADGAGEILVVTGLFDSIENVLAKLGLGDVDSFGNLIAGSEEFDLVNGDGSLAGTYPTFTPFFNDPANYADYRTIFLNCGIEGADNWLQIEANRNALRNWVEAGGRLYCTDWSYDFVEQLWPDRVDFADLVAGGDGLSETPETMTNALVGGSMETLPATIQDNLLSDWMQGLGAANASGVFNTVDWLPGWAVIDRVATEDVKVWATAEVGYGSQAAEERPVTITFAAGDGTVLFSSYHTEETPDPELLAQERVLQYLIFEVL